MSFDDYIFQASVNIAYIIFQQGTVIVYQKYFFVHDVYSALVTIYFCSNWNNSSSSMDPMCPILMGGMISDHVMSAYVINIE